MTSAWLPTSVRDFLRAPSGAVTTEWVVLTAAIIGLTLVMFGAVRTGSIDLAQDVGASLSAAGTETPALPDLSVPTERQDTEVRPDRRCPPAFPDCTGTSPPPMAGPPGGGPPVLVAPEPPRSGIPRG